MVTGSAAQDFFSATMSTTRLISIKVMVLQTVFNPAPSYNKTRSTEEIAFLITKTNRLLHISPESPLNEHFPIPSIIERIGSQSH